ncbi:MAG: hypothetical protein BWY46_00683 [Firmicutes bacterium ADurb.Bin300]|jgi:predicted metal-binding protein|nr:MAG: hypothetical protein BWY46_00683 [Firmicutes bacterium ADurb.Bin300]HOD01708.1 DUF2284 domain-containing protein [Clostridiales bacterium]
MIDISKYEGVFQHAVIKTSDIPFSAEVRKACEANMCGNYGKSWACPPGVGETEEIKNKILKFERALVFTHLGEIEDSFDFEGMQRVGQQADGILRKAVSRLKKENIPHIPLGCGACRLCEECLYPDLPCRHSEKMIVSVEACGIDVVKLAADCNINYHNGPNTVTYFCLIIY